MVSSMMLATGCATSSVSHASYATRTAAADSKVRDALNRERAIDPSSIPVNTVGVLPLNVISADTAYDALGFGVAALITTDLSRSAQLVVVERLHLAAVIRELDLVTTGRVDSSTAPRVGRIVGARRIIVGDLTIRTNGALKIGSKVANVTSGVVDASLSGDATVNQIFDAQKAIVFRLFDALGVTLSPAERRSVERRATQSLAALVAYGKGARAEQARDLTAANSYYRAATKIDPNFTEAAERAASVSGVAVDEAPAPESILRAIAISRDLVNRPTTALVGSGVDVPVSRQQLITITISVRTP